MRTAMTPTTSLTRSQDHQDRRSDLDGGSLTLGPFGVTDRRLI